MEGRDEKGRFAKNNKGKQLGTKHKIPTIVKEAIGEFFVDKITSQELEDIYNTLKKEEKVRFLAALLPYIVPKEKTELGISGEVTQKTIIIDVTGNEDN